LLDEIRQHLRRLDHNLAANGDIPYLRRYSHTCTRSLEQILNNKRQLSITFQAHIPNVFPQIALEDSPESTQKIHTLNVKVDVIESEHHLFKGNSITEDRKELNRGHLVTFPPLRLQNVRFLVVLTFNEDAGFLEPSFDKILDRLWLSVTFPLEK
jgi:hypothetical protein